MEAPTTMKSILMKIKRFLRKIGILENSVAIVGFSPKTFYDVEHSKAGYIWTLNYAFLVRESFPRIDRLFEIHKRDWYLRKENKMNEEYNAWLQQKHGIPIMMQEEALTPLIPDGVRYPKKEICEKFLKKFIRVDYAKAKEKYDLFFENPQVVEDEFGKHIEYFTSSFAFMMALALYEGFERIEIYGIDMEINTEYGYQKPCGEFWIGLALGLGVEIILPENCNLCKALLYGYEAIPYIDPPKIKEIVDYYQAREKEYFEEMGKYQPLVAQDPENEELQDKWLKASGWYYTYKGGVTAAMRLLEESDTYISRQFVEIKRGQYVNGFDYWKGLYNHKRGIFNQGEDRGFKDEALWKEILDARASMFANMGAMQTHIKLIRIMDLRPVDFDLKMDVTEDIDVYEKEKKPLDERLEDI